MKSYTNLILGVLGMLFLGALISSSRDLSPVFFDRILVCSLILGFVFVIRMASTQDQQPQLRKQRRETYNDNDQ